MPITFRNYCSDPYYSKDYEKIRKFLIALQDSHFFFGRWDWMVSHSYLNPDHLSKIGIWEMDGEIAALVMFDTVLDGHYFLLYQPQFSFLLPDMIGYTEKHLSTYGKIYLAVDSEDAIFQETAGRLGYYPTNQKEAVALIDFTNMSLDASLPEGFSLTTMQDTYDLAQYSRILWNGFNHELNGEGLFVWNAEKAETARKEFERPHVDRTLKIAVVAPNGDFVAYCGMWQDSASQTALVEPVATDPAYRKMGLGKAVVYAALRQCLRRNIHKALVGSSQQFYYRLGFQPYSTAIFWAKEESL